MVKIISDSTCDLSPELIAKYDIDILPLHILLGEDEYEDGRILHRSRFIAGLMKIKQHQKRQLRH